jgi:hypothetical protein
MDSINTNHKTLAKRRNGGSHARQFCGIMRIQKTPDSLFINAQSVGEFSFSKPRVT